MHKILIVDDAPEILLIIKKILTSSFDDSLNVITANRGEDALNIIQEHKPDLIILDWHMEGLSGIETLELLRKKPETAEIPVFIITRSNDNEHLKKAFDAGATDFISKPINKIELISRIKSALRLVESFRKIKEQKEKTDELNRKLNVERLRIDRLLHSIFPAQIVEELKQRGISPARLYNYTTVMFTDFVNFTATSEKLSPEHLLKILDNYFAAFDSLLNKYLLEKIKTIGDAYMVAGGLPAENKRNPFDVCLFALEIMYNLEKNILSDKLNIPSWKAKIGIHTGSLIAGIIGKKKIAYDIWGSTVNTASRMESASEPSRINISEKTYSIVKDFFICTPRGKIQSHGLGEVDMYFLERIKPDFASDDEGYFPNKNFTDYLLSLDE